MGERVLDLGEVVQRDAEEAGEKSDLLRGGAVDPQLLGSDPLRGEAVSLEQRQEPVGFGGVDLHLSLPQPLRSGHRSLRTKDAAASPQTIATHTAAHTR